MTFLDGIILLALAAALVRGFMVGGIRQVTSLVGLILAFVLAVLYMRPLGAQVASAFEISASVGELIAFAGIFVAVHVLLILATRFLEHLIKAFRLGILNKALGSALAAIKMVLVLSGIFVLLAHAGWPNPDVQDESAFYEPVREALPTAWDHTAAYVGDTDDLYDFFPGAADWEAFLPDTTDPGDGPDGLPDGMPNVNVPEELPELPSDRSTDTESHPGW